MGVIEEAVYPAKAPADTVIAPGYEVGDTAITPRPSRGKAAIPTVDTGGRAVGHAPLQRSRACPAMLTRNAFWRDAARTAPTTVRAQSRITITDAPGRAECDTTRIHTDRIGIMAEPDVPPPVANMGERRHFPERVPVSDGRSVTA